MKTMQMNSTLSHTKLNMNSSCPLGRRASFQCRASPLNPSSTITRSASIEKNKLHLSNLESLLQIKQVNPPPQQQKPEMITAPSTGSRNRNRRPPLHRFKLDRIPFLPRPTTNWFRMEDAGGSPVSPGHLNRLRRILSAASDPSPRNYIANRWLEFHGSNDWAGLLDPLDENLRREIVRYGEFVQAAYKHFDLEPAAPLAPPGDHQQPPETEMPSPDKFYKVTKGLYATSSIGMPKWVDDVAPEWMTQRSSRIGYVAVCDDKREIQRMGRRDIVISLRGTLTCLEWAENVKAQLVPLEESQAQVEVHPEVECGFLNLFTSPGAAAHVPSLADSIVEEIRRLTTLYKGEALSITIVGHSLGAALAVLAADHLSSTFTSDEEQPLPPVAVISFGGPKVGNQAFADRVQSRENVNVLRVVNAQDMVTRVPGMMVSEDVERTLREKGGQKVAGVLDAMDKGGYAHVGVELRIETKMSPYLRPDADMACCHDLEAYLHLVDGFMASNCPFRENAKRSLGKLLSEQGSNVKKLYMKKATAAAAVNHKTLMMESKEMSRSNSFQAV